MPRQKTTAKAHTAKADEVQKEEETNNAAVSPELLQEALEANQAYAEREAETEKRLAELEAELRSYRAKDNPVIKNRLDDFDEAGIQGVVEEIDGGFKLPAGNPESLQFKSKLDYEAFMAEEVEVHISEATENPDHIGFVISVNGKDEVFVQGETKKVKRYFVEGLARAKKTTFGNRQKQEHMVGDGENAYEYRAHTGVRYPFSVINDSRRGTDWLAAIRRQP